MYLFLTDCNEGWCPPSDWTTGDRPVVYRSFDNDRNIQLKNGSQIVQGKVRLHNESSRREDVAWRSFVDK